MPSAGIEMPRAPAAMEVAWRRGWASHRRRRRGAQSFEARAWIQSSGNRAARFVEGGPATGGA
eukprot:7624058-Pyramimonas_sp.AAC.1